MAPHLFVPKDLCPHPLSSYVGKNYGGVIIEPYCANCLTYILTLFHNTSTTRIRTKCIIAALQFCSRKHCARSQCIYFLPQEYLYKFLSMYTKYTYYKVVVFVCCFFYLPSVNNTSVFRFSTY